MTAISGTRRTIRERVDGSLVVQIEIDPPFVGEFHRMFPKIDMPVALAPLVAQFEQTKPVVAPPGHEMSSEGAGEPGARFIGAGAIPSNSTELKGGELARLAGMFCQQPEFWEFAGDVTNAEEAREWILRICDIKSRRELDHNVVAAHIFHQHIRLPYVEMRK